MPIGGSKAILWRGVTVRESEGVGVSVVQSTSVASVMGEEAEEEVEEVVVWESSRRGMSEGWLPPGSAGVSWEDDGTSIVLEQKSYGSIERLIRQKARNCEGEGTEREK